MQITSKGQITIPKHIRDFAGLQPHTEAEFVIEDGRVFLDKKPKRKYRSERGRKIIENLLKYANTRNALTADQIMEMTRGE